jgi:hypothetical protein
MPHLTQHAVHRYIERFEGNLSTIRAAQRLQRIFRRAKFRNVLPGQARLYRTGTINFIVCDDHIVTVYRLQAA